MGLSRSQVSQQLVYLLNATSVLGASTSAFESTFSVEDYLASELTMPLAAVETLQTSNDPDALGRLGVAVFRVSVVSKVVSETKVSAYVGSGGSSSSQRGAEDVIRELLQTLNSSIPGSFTASTHGFQGMVTTISQERTVFTQAQEFVVADFDLEVFDCSIADTYHSPRQFKATAASGGATLSWANPPARFDQYATVLRRGTNPGDAAPTGPTDGTSITVAGISSTSASDTGHSSGVVYNYSIFRTYTKATSGDQVSARATATVTTL